MVLGRRGGVLRCRHRLWAQKAENPRLWEEGRQRKWRRRENEEWRESKKVEGWSWLAGENGINGDVVVELENGDLKREARGERMGLGKKMMGGRELGGVWDFFFFFFGVNLKYHPYNFTFFILIFYRLKYVNLVSFFSFFSVSPPLIFY